MGTNIYSLLKRYYFFINCLFYVSIDELKSLKKLKIYFSYLEIKINN